MAGRKVLVFAHHKAVLDALETAVKRLHVGENGRSQQVSILFISHCANHNSALVANRKGTATKFLGPQSPQEVSRSTYLQ